MSRLQPLKKEDVPELAAHIEPIEKRMGFTPNSLTVRADGSVLGRLDVGDRANYFVPPRPGPLRRKPVGSSPSWSRTIASTAETD